jgi:very-short-patch-repair endonuclease
MSLLNTEKWKTKGEKKINTFLSEKKLEFFRQHKFSDCKNKFPLAFDFYIPSEKICIEYDGTQHFEMVKFFGGKKRFEGIKKNDEIKNKYCEKNNLKLLRIPYHEFNKIELILSEFLK